MFVLALDIAGAYAIARLARRLWMLLLGGLMVGLVATVAHSLVISFIVHEPLQQVLGQMMPSIIVHPIISVVAVLLWRWKLSSGKTR